MFYSIQIKKEYDKRISKSLIQSPHKQNIFASTKGVEPEDVKVVIIVHDFSSKSNSLGYAFGTNDGPDYSLMKIFDCIGKEFKDRGERLYDTMFGDEFKPNGKLDGWIKQGSVL